MTLKNPLNPKMESEANVAAGGTGLAVCTKEVHRIALNGITNRQYITG